MSSTVPGIDVSRYQGIIDWAGVKSSGAKFAFAKATEADTVVDPEFTRNWDGIGKAGMIRGAYHFYNTKDDPTTQAEHFISVAPLGSGDLPPAVDIEEIAPNSPPKSRAELVRDLHTFIDLLKQKYGVGPFIYTRPQFWNDNYDDSFSDYPLWVAEYEVSQPKPVTGWGYWSIWQYNSGGTVPGISGSNNVDLDTFNGGLDQLQRFLIP